MDVVLYQPEIPPNTGNIIRICANTGASLHLIRPLGFDWDDKRLRRAGLDYHDFARVTLYDNLPACETKLAGRRWFAMTTKGSRNFAEVEFQPDDVLLYEFTVDDPAAFSRPWTAQLPTVRLDGMIYEFACHETNRGMMGLLSGARAEEAAAQGN